jgi:hypothetical protein
MLFSCFYCAFTVCWPGLEKVMTPPQAHINWQLLVSAFFLQIMTVGEPGAQGVVVTGIQGMGVKTPIAAEVAAAT